MVCCKAGWIFKHVPFLTNETENSLRDAPFVHYNR